MTIFYQIALHVGRQRDRPAEADRSEFQKIENQVEQGGRYQDPNLTPTRRRNAWTLREPSSKASPADWAPVDSLKSLCPRKIPLYSVPMKNSSVKNRSRPTP